MDVSEMTLEALNVLECAIENRRNQLRQEENIRERAELLKDLDMKSVQKQYSKLKEELAAALQPGTVTFDVRVTIKIKPQFSYEPLFDLLKSNYTIYPDWYSEGSLHFLSAANKKQKLLLKYGMQMLMDRVCSDIVQLIPNTEKRTSQLCNKINKLQKIIKHYKLTREEVEK